jgi:cysteine-rich repeat protein
LSLKTSCLIQLAALLLGLLAASGCLDAASTRCNDLYCPVGTVCAAQANRCATPAQISACNGKQDTDDCSVPGVGAAQCSKGVCVSQVCGDGLVSGDELCDDGNTSACDGCSADCRSDESCGNDLVDCQEECDEGVANSDSPNALCRVDCRRQRCGDEIVDDRSGEDCDGAPNPGASCGDYGY